MKSLKNKLLVSMPNMSDPYFAKSVIYVFEDDQSGTLGLIINKPISQMKIVNIDEKDKLFDSLLSASKNIYFGGPVMLNEACIIRIDDEEKVDFSKKIHLSNDLKSIKNMLIDNNFSKNEKLVFGHSSWGKNQLKNEIKRGDWLIVNYDDSFFNSDPDSMWANLIKIYGLDEFGFTGMSGVS